MSFPRYPKYKASGVEWLGDVPEVWEVRRLKDVAYLTMGQSPNSDDCNSDGNGRPFLQGNADFGDAFPVARSFCPVATKIAHPGDILFSVRAPVGAINTADQEYGIGRGLCAITARHGIFPRYLTHEIGVIKSELLSVATGSTYEAVTTQQVGNATCLTPPLPEQTAIADFLDWVTAKIDELVAEQRRLMELLKEKRQAVISQAVTKGLDPHTPMKSSGIEWLGDVPEGWEVKPLRFLCYCLDGSRVPLNSAQRAEKPGTIPYWGANSIVDYIDEALFDEDLVFLGEDGAPFFDKSKPVAFFSKGKVWPNNHVHVLRPAFTDTGKFIAHALNITDFAQFIDGSTRDKLTQGAMKAIPLPFPPIPEQAAILEFLDTELAKFDTLTAEAQRAIDLLQERRTALISAAVTGQIDVRQQTRN